MSPQDRRTLLQVARRSIGHGLGHDRPLEVDPEAFAAALRPLRATFVTLEREGRLRGCVGTLEARFPLVADVAGHAFAAAFQDPRFGRLAAAELAGLALHISVLSPCQVMEFQSEEELLAQLRPGIDGLVLQYGERRATFLPAVWETLPDPYLFLVQLKYKAGLPLDFWSPELRV
ncbi:MAG: AmmeMemoRadiSam system protein A, partial [Pseudomonadota bacterium]|nr:AmmeMemoRadiSam system protein A [Pseudomonadota bacterium]